MRRLLFLAIATLVVATAMPATVIARVAKRFEQTGLASWYGAVHQGRLTASGEPFDQNELTAAHPTLPFGSVLRVTNLANGAQVNVRVNDRGPGVAGRVVDLSRAAARALDAVHAGVVRVHLALVAADGTAAAPPDTSRSTPHVRRASATRGAGRSAPTRARAAASDATGAQVRSAIAVR